jgi:hypothetical protein
MGVGKENAVRSARHPTLWGTIVAGFVVVIPTSAALADHYGHDGIRAPALLTIGPVMAVLVYPLIRHLYGEPLTERKWTELAEPFRTRFRSLLWRYLGLSWLWAVLSVSVLLVRHLGFLDFGTAMGLLGALLAMMLIAGLLLAGSGVLPRVLTDDPVVLATVGTAWWFAAVGHVVNGPVFALDGVLMGAEDFAYLRTWTVLAALVGGVTGQLVVTAGGGLLALWVAVQAMMLVRLASLLVRVRGSAWARTGHGVVTEPGSSRHP